MFKYVLLITLSLVTVGALAKTDSNAREIERFNAIVLSNTQIRQIHSNTNDVDYKLYINVPASYHLHNTKKYPVLYVLDADYSFALAKQQSEHLSDRNRINEMIIVGIAYAGPLQYRKNRTRDYTISHVPDGGYGPEFQKYSGGADKFIGFIKNELVPYINESFPTTGSNGLVGHSYGGLFANYVLITQPDLFDKLLIVSPSLWYDNERIMEKAVNIGSFKLKTFHKVYFAIGGYENGGSYRMIDEQNRMVDILNSKQQDKLFIASHVMDGFDHDTVFPAAISRGLKVLYG